MSFIVEPLNNNDRNFCHPETMSLKLAILRTLLDGIMSDYIFKIIFFGVSNDIFEENI